MTFNCPKVKVEVTHFWSPKEFSLILASQKELNQHIRQKVNEVAMSERRLDDPESSCELGSLCLARTVQDDTFARARIIKLEPIKSNQEEMGVYAKVHFIDIGHFQWEPAHRLRTMPEDLKCYPSQAQRCYIEGLCPLNKKEGWSHQSIQLCKQMLQQTNLACTATLKSTFQLQKWGVDLTTGEPTIANSLFESLLRTKLARLTESSDITWSEESPQPRPRIPTGFILVADSVFRARIASFISPDDFHLYPLATVGMANEILEALRLKMSSLYDREGISTITQPEPGELYVYRDAKRNLHRVKCISNPGGLAAELLLIDHGSNTISDPRYMYKLDDSLLSIPIQTIHVRMAGVVSADDHFGWEGEQSNEFVSRLGKILQDETLVVYVNKVQKGQHGKQASVLLFSFEERKRSVNEIICGSPFVVKSGEFFSNPTVTESVHQFFEKMDQQ